MLRVVLVILVIAVLADALLYGGAYTQMLYGFIKMAADQFVSMIGETVDDVNP